MAPQTRVVYTIGTLDTKEEEILYIADVLKTALATMQVAHVKVAIIDVSAGHERPPSVAITPAEIIGRLELFKYHPDASRRDASKLPMDRYQAVAAVGEALEAFLKAKHEEGLIVGSIGAGGSGGTSLIAPALRALPVGVPKAIVSTVASGHTAPYVEGTDLALFPSVVDVAGLNSVSRVVLSNAAWALAGMVAGRVAAGSTPPKDPKPTIGLTMFGVTTPCVDAVRKRLEADGAETLVFHATGTGGKAMEKLVSQGLIQGVIDVTTTEVADYQVGGEMPCDRYRFEASIEKGIPLVVSVGALDMVNFGAKDTVPEQFKRRKLYVHNLQVTLMRTNAAENRAFAHVIANKLNKSTAPVTILLPEKGVSALDSPGKPFYDPEATGSLFDELEKRVVQTDTRKVKRLPYHINDPRFAAGLVDAYYDIAGSPKKEDDGFSFASLGGDSGPAPEPLAQFPKTLAPPKRNRAPLDLNTLRGRVLQKLRDVVDEGLPIIGAGAGTGLSAKMEEAGGADMIIIYNSGRFRMGGRGSLSGLMPYKDANAVVVEMADEVLPIVKSAPVLAGVCATDPFRRMDKFLEQLQGMGFAGVQNFPTVGLIDGTFRQNLEETGMGFGLEVDMIARAHKMGLLTTPYAFDEEQARAMAEAGADIVVAHMGLTTAGSIGAKTAVTLEQSVKRVQAISDAARDVNPDILVLCHGGPISKVEDAKYVLRLTHDVHGFYGASSMERLPVETAIADCVKLYKGITLYDSDEESNHV